MVFFNRKCNNGLSPLDGQRFTVSMFSMPPYLYLDKGKNESYGIIVDIMDVLASYHNFDYEKILSDNWLVVHQNNSIGGALGYVRNIL